MVADKPTQALHNWTCVNSRDGRWLVGYDGYGNKMRTGYLTALDEAGRRAEDGVAVYVLGEPGPPAGPLALETK